MLTTEADYEQMVENLDAVLDAGGEDEKHPLSGLAGRMGDLIAAYEGRHYPIESTGVFDRFRLVTCRTG